MTRRVALVQLGLGRVGSAVVALVREQAPRWRERYGVDLRYAALGDSTGLVATPQPGDGDDALPVALADALRARSSGARLADLPGALLPAASDAALEAALAAVASPADIVVLDCATGRATAPLLLRVRALGMSAVLANKDPLVGPCDEYRRLVDSGASGSLRIGATVGAGLPILATLQALVASGDTLRALDARVSGSLGYLCDRLSRGDPFDAAVRDAMARGYTEPDPRLDLSGHDVARKLVILARTAGLPAELDRVRVESLVPPGADSLSAAEFTAALPDFSAHLADRAAAARADGRVLRYTGSLAADGTLSAALIALPPDHPLAYGAGPDNVFVLRTARYDERPLIIAGPGAGMPLTAGAVVADLLRAIGVL